MTHSTKLAALAAIAFAGMSFGCSAADPSVTTGEHVYFQPTAGLEQHQIPAFEEFQRTTRVSSSRGELYVVQGDLPIHSTKELRAFYDQAVAGQVPKLAAFGDGTTPEKIANGGQLGLGYCVSTEFDGYSNGLGGTMYDTLVEGMAIALRQWAQGGNMWFRHVSSADADCTDGALPAGVDARVIPWEEDSSCWGCTANSISFSPLAQQSAQQASDTLAHESGHMLRFTHENFRPDWEDACPADGTAIPLTAQFDPDSIMLVNQGTAGDPANCTGPDPLPFWCYCADIVESNSKVSAGDRRGAMELYGVPAWMMALL